MGGWIGAWFLQPAHPTGFDEVTAVIGGVFIGIAIALGLGLLLYFKLNQQQLRKATWLVLACAVVIGMVVAIGAASRPSGKDHPPPRLVAPKTPNL